MSGVYSFGLLLDASHGEDKDPACSPIRTYQASGFALEARKTTTFSKLGKRCHFPPNLLTQAACILCRHDWASRGAATQRTSL